MATDEELTVTADRKVQLEQFEPITFGASLVVSLEEGDDVDEVYHEKAQALESYVDREITRRVTAQKMAEDGGDSE